MKSNVAAARRVAATLKIELAEMFLEETKTGHMLSDNDPLVTDDQADVETLLRSLADGRLATRIVDAARLAAASHMCLTARVIQSAVEAENSAQ